MSIKRTIITTATIVVAVAMVASVAGAQTPTIAQLMAEIQQLTAQLNALQGSGATPVPTGTVACSGVTFTRNLVVGSTGSDVKCLQVLLNTNGYTIARTGAGSPGAETSYFGSLTLAAVKQFQVAKGYTPANQVGPLTRAALNALLGTTTGGGTTPVVTPTGAGLSVMLASDNPASGSIIAGQSIAPLARLVFVNGDNAAVTVTGLKLHRMGISADADLANVYLFQGANRLTDAAGVSAGLISFNDSTGIFTVPSGSSTEITVYADITAGYGGESVGITLNASTDVTTNASSIRGNFPVSGNLMTVFYSSSTSLATVVPVATASTTPGTNNSLVPQTGTVIFDNQTTIGVRSVTLQWLRFKLIGSIGTTDVQNFTLYIDGVQAGAAVANLDSNGYVTFNLTSSPVTLNTGARDIKVLADVVGGSYKNFYTSIRVAADIRAVDSQYGVNILANQTFPISTGVQTIASGAITVQKTVDSPAGNVVNTASTQVLGRFTLKATGERVKVDTLRVAVLCTNAIGDVTLLRNGALYANGVQIGSTTNLKCNAASTGGGLTPFYTNFSLGSSLIIDPATPVTLEVKADIWDYTVGFTSGSVGLQNNDTLQVSLLDPSGNGMGQVSYQTVDVPSTTVAANSLTIGGGSLTLSKYAADTDRTVVSPLINQQLAHFTLTSATTEAVNLNTILVSLTRLETYTNNLYVTYGPNTTSTIATPATSGNNTFTINYQLQAGQTIDIKVFGDVNSSKAGSTTGIANVEVKGITANSSTAVTTTSDSVLAGQTITFGSGSFTATQDSATPVIQMVSGGQPVTAGIFKFTAQNDSYTINELKFALGSATSAGTANAAGIVSSVALKDNATGQTIMQNGQAVVAPVLYYGSQYVAYFTGLTIPMPANTAKSLAVVLNLSSGVSADTATTNKDVEPYLTYIKVANSQGVQTSDLDGAGDILGTQTVNGTYVFKAIPTVAFAGANSSATNGSNVELYKFTVGAPNGAVAVKQFKFTITQSDNNVVNNYLNNFTFFRGSTNITSSVTILNATGPADLKTSNTLGSGTVVVTFTTEENVGAGSSNTYSLKANVNNFNYVSTAGADAVTTYMPYDSAQTTAASSRGGAFLRDEGADGIYGVYTAVTGGETAKNFIWSDLSAASPTIHSYTNGAASYDWYDGYLVLTSNLTTETVSAQ